MTQKDKTKEEFIEEIRLLQKRIAELEIVDADRERAEDALRKSEQKYRELVMLANSIILRWTRDGRITFLNEFGQRFFGYTEAEICGRHVVGTIVPASESSGRNLPSLMDEICENPAAFEQNINENMRRNGEHVWIAWTNKIVLDPQGQVAEILSIGVDITERKRAQEALCQEEELLSTMFSSVPVGICVMKDRVYQSVNKYWCEHFGYKEEELLGETTRTLYESDAEYERVGRELYANLDQRVKRVVQARLRAKDGSFRDILLRAAMLKQGESSAGTVVVIEDITERKQAQEKEMLAMVELAKVKEIDKVKNTFIASMSHELRTPLNSIIGFTGILLMGMTGELNEEQKKQLGMVKGSASHLLALINDVIDVSKVEAGKIALAVEEFELEKVINEAKDSVANNINDKKLELAIDLPAGLKIKSDRRRVKQIIINLLSNAVKFTEHGKITVEAARKKDKIKVKVTDTGVGIRAEDRDKLFKQFSRIIIPGRPLQEGTGLGLYLSQKVAGMLGGEITAQSEIGRGSVFILELPYEIKAEVVYA
ncbi:MAG: PAS domain-containing sensor histidine kinase [Sedimentisphaerales bacterium]